MYIPTFSQFLDGHDGPIIHRLEGLTDFNLKGLKVDGDSRKNYMSVRPTIRMLSFQVKANRSSNAVIAIQILEARGYIIDGIDQFIRFGDRFKWRLVTEIFCLPLSVASICNKWIGAIDLLSGITTLNQPVIGSILNWVPMR